MMKQYNKLFKAILIVAFAYIIYRLWKAWRQSKMMEGFAASDPRDFLYATLPAKDMTVGNGVTPRPAGATMAPLPKAIGVSTDLMPPPTPVVENDFAEFAPKNALADRNFLEADKMIGIDTIEGSLKNANYSLRADPPLKKDDSISPWMVSTFTHDSRRKKLDC